MNDITYGYFDESGDTGAKPGYYIVAIVLFHNQQDAFKAKAILKRERKNNKKFLLGEFKFHDMHRGNTNLITSLRRVLTNIGKSNIEIYATIVKKPGKKSFVFQIARWRLILELFKQLSKNAQLNRMIDLRADNRCFGTIKEDHKRVLFCKGSEKNKEDTYISKELSYAEYKEFVEPGEDMKCILNKTGCQLVDWKVFTVKAGDSEQEQGIQIADLVAGAIYQKYQNNNEEYFELIKPRIKKIFDESLSE